MKRFLYFISFFITFSCYCSAQENYDGAKSYGKINVENKNIKIYSQAYMHYPHVFNDFDRTLAFDTTSFEERFFDTTYANTTKIDADYQFRRIYEILSLDIFYGGNKEEVWFNFKKNDGYAAPLIRYNPEINAFTGMVWVFKGNLSRKEFSKKYIFRKRKFFLKRKERINWSDVRIYYDNNAQIFTLKLKNLDGFTEIQAYPRYTSVSRSVKEAQERYEKVFASYLKKLGKRKSKFDKSITKRQQIHKKALIKYDEKLWASFQENYMSEEEKMLSREEWLLYYDIVIANEIKAMGNAEPMIENVERSMKIDGYKIKPNPFITSDQFNEENAMTKTLYQKTNSDKVAITQVLVVDLTNKRYQKYSGSKGIKTINVELNKNNDCVLLAWLRNGDIGYLTMEDFNAIEINEDREAMISLEIIKRKMASVQTIRNHLNF